MKLFSSKTTLGGLALAGALMLTGVAGFAQQSSTQGQDGQQRTEREGRRGGGGGKAWGGKRDGFGGRFGADLNLTDAQKEQMRAIAARYRESTKALREQMRAGRRGGDMGSMNGTFDEGAVRAAAQARANASVELEVAHARMRSEMYNVLTAEQKAQMAARRQQWEQKRQERRARRNQGQPQQQ